MKEQQIVITLTAEQFDQVQKLARAAGSKSVGAFIRERFLESFGIEPQALASQAGHNPNWQNIAGQIRRVHRELQVFIAESTAIAEFANENGELTFQEERPVAEAGRAVELRQSTQDISQAPAHSESDVFDSAKDEMEQLAEKAFAISPRLGALETEVSGENGFGDPLDDLLEDSLLKETEEDDDEDYEDDEDVDQLEESHIASPDAPVADRIEHPDVLGENVNEPDYDYEQNIYKDPEQKHSEEDSGNDELLQGEDDFAAPNISPPVSGGPPPRKRRT